MTSLIFDVSGLAGNPGASRPIRQEVLLHDLGSAVGRLVEDAPVVLDLVAHATVEGVLVTGDVKGTLELVCSRCTAEFRLGFTHELDDLFRFEKAASDDLAIELGRIDMKGPITDAVVLSIPAYPLHDPACRGLCPRCGIDRNIEECPHSDKPVDIRWEPLKELLND
jgi:uncharacterized protein